MARNGADILVETLLDWGVDTVFGMPGDGINGIMEALRTRQDRVRFVQVRHEEAAALAACAHAKLTGRLGCCLATTGPGGLHLLNGLYDAKMDRAPVIAVTGLPYHDLAGTDTQQDVDHTRVFQDVALYTVRVGGAAHMAVVAPLACRAALSGPGVAHLAVPVDVQEEGEDADEPSPRNAARRTGSAWAGGLRVPDEADLDRAAAVLDAGSRVAILVGRGALGARRELLEVADLLAAPVAKALLGKAVVPDDHPMTTGGVGLLGTRPSQEALEGCDTLLIVGSTFPYVEYYPRPGQARGVQVDRDPTRIGLRFPAEVGLAGDAAATLGLLARRLRRKADRSFLEAAQAGKREWDRLLRESAGRPGRPMKPGRPVRDLGDRLAGDAVVVWDSGHNTGLLARYVQAREGQDFIGSGLLATMGCAVPYAVAAALACPGRQVVAVVGDGGLAMLLGELATVARYRLPVKLLVIKDDSLGQIRWEQMQFLGNPEFGCDLEPIDFVRVAGGFGIRAWRVEDPESCGGVLDEALAHPGPALVEAVVDPDEPLLPPKRVGRLAGNLDKALAAGTPGADRVRAALAQEPARSMLRP